MNLDYLCGFAVNQSLGATDSGSIARIGIIYDGCWGLPFEGWFLFGQVLRGRLRPRRRRDGQRGRRSSKSRVDPDKSHESSPMRESLSHGFGTNWQMTKTCT